jgi:hypothetical protein
MRSAVDPESQGSRRFRVIQTRATSHRDLSWHAHLVRDFTGGTPAHL